jgi:hypothetical protein
MGEARAGRNGEIFPEGAMANAAMTKAAIIRGAIRSIPAIGVHA